MSKKIKQKDDSLDKKKSMLQDYANLRKQMRRDLSVEDFTSSTEYTKDMLKHHYGSLSNIDSQARETYPKCFLDVYIEDLMTDKQLDKLREEYKEYQKKYSLKNSR